MDDNVLDTVLLLGMAVLAWTCSISLADISKIFSFVLTLISIISFVILIVINLPKFIQTLKKLFKHGKHK